MKLRTLLIETKELVIYIELFLCFSFLDKLVLVDFINVTEKGKERKQFRQAFTILRLCIMTFFYTKHTMLNDVALQEVSKLRYKLCPRVMKERKFWRIYFILVNSHVDP